MCREHNFNFGNECFNSEMPYALCFISLVPFPYLRHGLKQSKPLICLAIHMREHQQIAQNSHQLQVYMTHIWIMGLIFYQCVTLQMVRSVLVDCKTGWHVWRGTCHGSVSYGLVWWTGGYILSHWRWWWDYVQEKGKAADCKHPDIKGPNSDL